MLGEFVTLHRSEILERCRSRVAVRVAPRATELELEQGIPLFLDQLVESLRSKLVHAPASAAATLHGGSMLRRGFTVAQVVQDYGDVCQTITEIAVERGATISTQEFQALNRSLDDAIAQAVTGYAQAREIEMISHQISVDASAAAVELGVLAHELRNLLGTAILAFDALKDGGVGIAGSTGAVLERSLLGLHHLIDRTLADVRLTVGIALPEPIVVAELIEEIEVSAMLLAKSRGHHLTVETHTDGAVLKADREILAAVVANLIQNACKYTRPHSNITLRTTTTPARVRIEVEDQCGGLPPGASETLFKPFVQRSADRTGLGLGLAICLRGVDALNGSIHVTDLPGKGCVFSVEVPRPT
ncbi:MAG: HAMP domain-containing sensor histidine kinase [Kofleriaceae bacterium]